MDKLRFLPARQFLTVGGNKRPTQVTIVGKVLISTLFFSVGLNVKWLTAVWESPLIISFKVKKYPFLRSCNPLSRNLV